MEQTCGFFAAMCQRSLKAPIRVQRQRGAMGGHTFVWGAKRTASQLYFPHHIYCAQSKVKWVAHGVNWGGGGGGNVAGTHTPLVTPLVWREKGGATPETKKLHSMLTILNWLRLSYKADIVNLKQ